MGGNTFGRMLSMTSFGESHGEALGVVVDGVPGNLSFSLEKLQACLDRRAPGSSAGVTARKEADRARVISGVFEGKTTGAPIMVMVENTNQRSGDYDKLKEQYRPGHADKTVMMKYGHRDHRGGGRSSGRETLARVIGGYFASLILPNNCFIRGLITQLGPFEWEFPEDLHQDFSPYSIACPQQNEEVEKFLLTLKKNGDSRGGRVTLVVKNPPAALGEPSFDKLKADLAKAVMSIGACVGFSYGLGEKFSQVAGKDLKNYSNPFGGIEGGISNGDDIILNIIFKPTSTVGEKAKEGRHDPCIMPRAIPVVESMVQFVLADHYLRQNAYQNI